MNRVSLFLVLYVYIYTAEWTLGEFMYDPKLPYESQTDYLDDRPRGMLHLPPCVKNLLNCWEFINPEYLCKFDKNSRQISLETICMDLRYQCQEPVGPMPFPGDSKNIQFCGGMDKVHTLDQRWTYN